MTSIYRFLIALAISTGLQAEALPGAAVFTLQACQSCHLTEAPTETTSITDQLNKKGPELWYAGSKFQSDWLITWLADPAPIRRMHYNSLTEPNLNNHPVLSPNDSRLVGDYLMTLGADLATRGQIKPRTHPKGRMVFKKKMACDGCHQYAERNNTMGGLSGPPLSDAGIRLNPDWVLAYLSDPEAFKPVMMMPSFKGMMSKKELEYLAAYIANFKSPRVQD